MSSGRQPASTPDDENCPPVDAKSTTMSLVFHLWRASNGSAAASTLHGPVIWTESHLAPTFHSPGELHDENANHRSSQPQVWTRALTELNVQAASQVVQQIETNSGCDELHSRREPSKMNLTISTERERHCCEEVQSKQLAKVQSTEWPSLHTGDIDRAILPIPSASSTETGTFPQLSQVAARGTI